MEVLILHIKLVLLQLHFMITQLPTIQGDRLHFLNLLPREGIYLFQMRPVNFMVSGKLRIMEQIGPKRFLRIMTLQKRIAGC